MLSNYPPGYNGELDCCSEDNPCKTHRQILNDDIDESDQFDDEK